MKSIEEPARRVPLYGEYEVAVLGDEGTKVRLLTPSAAVEVTLYRQIK